MKVAVCMYRAKINIVNFLGPWFRTVEDSRRQVFVLFFIQQKGFCNMVDILPANLSMSVRKYPSILRSPIYVTIPVKPIHREQKHGSRQ